MILISYSVSIQYQCYNCSISTVLVPNTDDERVHEGAKGNTHTAVHL